MSINPDEIYQEQLSEAIMEIVLEDITGRRGWRQEWDQFDSEVQSEIKDTLWKKIGIALKADAGTPLETLLATARRKGGDDR